MGELDCSSEVSGDYYGIGVRLGIYLIWVTSYLANQFVPEEVSAAQDANAIFLLALLGSIFRGTIAEEENRLRFVDGLILMQLCAGYLFGCFSLWGYRTVHYEREGTAGIRHFGGYGTHARLVLATAISGHEIWFWTSGLKNGLMPLMELNTDGVAVKKEECYPLWTFFFWKLDVLGPIRGFYIFISIACSIYFGVMLSVAAIKHLFAQFGHQDLIYETGLNKKESVYTMQVQTLLSMTNLNVYKLHYIYVFCRVGNLLWIIFSVITVEMTVKWDHILNVIGPNNTIALPSQLLPLLIGSLGFIRILYLMYRNKRPRKSRGYGFEGLGTNKGTTPKIRMHHDQYHDESLEDNNSRKLWVRYLVAALPWLSMDSRWGKSVSPNKKENDRYSNKRVDGSTPIPHELTRSLVATTPGFLPNTPAMFENGNSSEIRIPLLSSGRASPNPSVR